MIGTGGPPLDDSYWHVTDYYKNIRDKLKSLDSQQGYCNEIEPRLPGRICSLAMKVRWTGGAELFLFLNVLLLTDSSRTRRLAGPKLIHTKS